MSRFSPDTKKKLTAIVDLGKTVFHLGFIPTVLYLGFKQGTDPGMPPISFMSLLWQ